MWTAGQIWGFTHENHHHHQLTSISIAPDRFFSTPKLKWDSKVGLLVIFPCYHFHHFLGQGSIIHFQISKSLSLSLSLSHTHTHTHTHTMCVLGPTSHFSNLGLSDSCLFVLLTFSLAFVAMDVSPTLRARALSLNLTPSIHAPLLASFWD